MAMALGAPLDVRGKGDRPQRYQGLTTTATATVSVAGAIAKSNELQASAQVRMEKRHCDLDRALEGRIKAGSRRGVVVGL
jgi:hypothetical protein